MKMMNQRLRRPARRKIISQFFVLWLAAATVIAGNRVAVGTKVPIPNGYKSWSLFLVNNPQWVVAESNEKIKKLYNQFQAFGGAIGRDNVAVWFWSQDTLEDSFQYRAVDVVRSAEFCERLHLSPGNGPYILVTTEYPGSALLNDPASFLPTKLNNYYVVSLNNKGSDEIMQVLTRIADKITADRPPDLRSNADDYWRSWRLTFEAIRDFLSSRQITVSIKTPVSEVQVR